MDIILSGMGGRIQASYHKGNVEKAPIAVVFHDDPAKGGSMNEAVAYTLFWTFMKRGFNVLRINFRGVGLTQGEFEGGEAELADAASAMDWIQHNNPETKAVWLAGVGFGGWVAMQVLMRRIDIDGYVVANVPQKKFDFTFFSPAPCPGLFIGAEKDDMPSPDDTRAFVANINKQKAGKADAAIVPGADRTFKDHLGGIYESIAKYLEKRKKQDEIRAKEKEKERAEELARAREIAGSEDDE